MKAELIKFKVHSKFFGENKWKTFCITDDLSFITQNTNLNLNKLEFYWFSGFRDVANNEIYEGHILKFTMNNIGDVVGHVKFSRERNRNGFYIVTIGSISHVPMNEFFMNDANALIIGNVIDHRHLIEKH
jgi:hypothetical protein